MADFGIGGLHVEGIGEGNGPGYYNLKLGSEAAADTNKQVFKVGREDEGIIQSSFLKLQYCKPHFHYSSCFRTYVPFNGRLFKLF